MTTQSGYSTNGNYIKYKSGFTSFWIVETETERESFKTEADANAYIILLNLSFKPKTELINEIEKQKFKPNPNIIILGS